MTATVRALPQRPGDRLMARLRAEVRPEFTGPLIRVAAENPVFGRGRCQVPDCAHPAWTRLLCHGHYLRWRRDGRPEVAGFAAGTRPLQRSARADRVGTFDLAGLGPQAGLEIGYVLQCRHDDRGVRLLASNVRHLIRLLGADGGSLLDHRAQYWVDAAAAKELVDPSRLIGLIRYGHRRLVDLVEEPDAETEFTRDVWRVAILGVPAPRGPHQLRFDAIDQPWLRAVAKRWARFRLSIGKTIGTVDIDLRALRWFSRFLTQTHPTLIDEAGLTREVFEGYLPWLAGAGLATHTHNTYLVCLRGFLDGARRYGWLTRLPDGATIYLDELPRRPQPLPRFIPEYVMAQLENPTNLAALPDDTTRHLIIVLIETGLRAGDACALPFNPVIADSAGWPCLRYLNTKMATEQLVPLSAAAAEAIRAQQAHLRTRWATAPPPRLFPSPFTNPDGVRPFSYATLRARLAHWQHLIDLRDEAGAPIRATAHQFRHTLGTRMINKGVPQHVVQKLLGHASPLMTARYATLHDTTVRRAFDDYQQHRVDVHGHRLDFDPAAPTAEAEWIKHSLARVQASLPNGYCGRPPQQNCPHPNACLTCPDFQTTPAFLPIHRRQRDDTLTLINLAEQAGRARLAQGHRQVHHNLNQIITALETLEDNPT